MEKVLEIQKGIVLAFFTRTHVLFTAGDVTRLVSRGLVLITVTAYRAARGHEYEKGRDRSAFAVTQQGKPSMK